MRLAALLLSAVLPLASAAELRVLKDVSYRDPVVTPEAYARERCKLDLTLPEDASPKGFATLVWFHGGGLKAGSKDSPTEHCAAIGASFARAGIAFVAADYRLSPKGRYPEYVDDAAAAFTWAVRNIATHGGDPRKVYVGGHSAGGYLALLVGFDPSRLRPHGLSLGDVAGIAQVSGQVFTHYTVREERGISKHKVIADEAAPCFHIQRALPPVFTVYAQKDMLGRAEENQFMVAMLKSAGHAENYSLRVDDRDHGSVGHNLRNDDDPARLAFVNFIRKTSSNR